MRRGWVVTAPISLIVKKQEYYELFETDAAINDYACRLAEANFQIHMRAGSKAGRKRFSEHADQAIEFKSELNMSDKKQFEELYLNRCNELLSNFLESTCNRVFRDHNNITRPDFDTRKWGKF